MAKYVIFYNPSAGEDGKNFVRERLNLVLAGNRLSFTDITKLGTVAAASYFDMIEPDAKFIIAGGDGTLHKFVNTVNCDAIKQEIYYYATGSDNQLYKDLTGNLYDFFPAAEGLDMNLVKRKNMLLQLNKFIKNLPTVTTEGKVYKFINGVGIGLDGYACETADRLKRNGKKSDFNAIARRGILHRYKPRNAEVYVDGKAYNFENVWLASTMKGRYLCGGLMPTPSQDRVKSEKLSICVISGKSRLSALSLLPTLYNGTHIEKDTVTVLEGETITVRFDTPCALHIDGEIIPNASSYTVRKQA